MYSYDTASLDTIAALFTDQSAGQEPESFFADLMRRLPPPVQAHLLMQMLCPVNTDEGKRQALETAIILGPDYAQNLYRFAVLVTKLA